MDLFGNTLIQQGGYTLYPLFILSIIAVLIFVERSLFLHKGQINSQDFLAGIRNLLNKKRLVEALTLCEETPGPLARVVKSALLQYGATESRIRSAIESAALIEVPILERRIGSLAAIARIAPLIGFIGTLIAAFQALVGLEAANADSAYFVQALARAIISSAVGLGIAALASLAHHFLHGRVRALVLDIERVGHAIHELLTSSENAIKTQKGEGE
jgi:biopolymer transport protein ExbB